MRMVRRWWRFRNAIKTCQGCGEGFVRGFGYDKWRCSKDCSDFTLAQSR